MRSAAICCRRLRAEPHRVRPGLIRERQRYERSWKMEVRCKSLGLLHAGNLREDTEKDAIRQARLKEKR